MIDVLEYRKRNVQILRMSRHVKDIHSHVGVNAVKLHMLFSTGCAQLIEPRNVRAGYGAFRPQEDQDEPPALVGLEFLQVVLCGVNALKKRALRTFEVGKGRSSLAADRPGEQQQKNRQKSHCRSS